MLIPITITFIIIIFFFIFRRPRATCNSPPSPPWLPLIGNLHQFGSLPHRSLQALSKKYGPIMLLHIGRVPTIVVSSAELACQVMKTQDLNFASRPRSSMAKMLLYDCDIAFTPYGEYWRQARKICVLHLLSNKMVQSFQSIREDEVSLMINMIRSSSDLVNLSKFISALANDIICRVALGRKYYEGVEGASKVRDMLAEFGNLLGSFPVSDFIPWLSWLDHLTGLKSRARKNSRELDCFLDGVLDEHLQAKRDVSNRSNSEKDDRDFVDVLLSLDEKNDSVGISLSRDNIKAIILDMFAAGTDTIATAFEWAMSELIRNPKVMRTVQKEVRGVFGSNATIREMDIDRMIYLMAVIKESLRLHSPVPLLVPRETVQDTKLEGFHIPRGTRVLVNAWAIGRDPRSWDKPEEFIPDRFINSNVDFRGQSFQFIPFGAGRRSCPGIDFAVSTIELTLAHILNHFDWELPKGMEEEVLEMTETPGLTTHRKSELILIAKPWVISLLQTCLPINIYWRNYDNLCSIYTFPLIFSTFNMYQKS